MQDAFLFPGQGSQAVGMMKNLMARAEVADTFREASAVLGYDLRQLVEEGPAEQLNQTLFTQPAMLAAGIAAYRAWRALGGAAPAFLAGHSLGEYTALVAAEALDLADALRLVRYRAEVMQAAVPEGSGAMAAILGLEDEAVREVCAQAAHGEVLEAVNYNSPGQVVIAGHKNAVERGMALARERGAKRALALPVSVPSHSSLMRPAAAHLAEKLAQTSLRAPCIAVWHNADVAAHSEPSRIRDALTRQLYAPVRWVETIHALKAQGAERFLECGPGKVLAGLNKRIDDRLATFALTDEAAIRAAL